MREKEGKGRGVLEGSGKGVGKYRERDGVTERSGMEEYVFGDSI